jgi:hypothetical protein
MKLKSLCFGAAAAAITAMTAATVQAAPLSGVGNELKIGGANAAVEKAAYRRCWIRYGVRHCRWVDYYDDDYPYYGYGGPYYGYGPGIGFYFGGHGGHFHGGHFHGGHHH